MKAFLRPGSRRAALLAVGSASIVLLAACSTGGGDDDGNDSGGSSGADTTLAVGTILPQTGNLAILGPPEFAGVDLAQQDLEAAGYEFEVTVQHEDSGDTTTELATQAANELVDAGVDIVVGAASSGVSETFIDTLIDANVVQISPANTAPSFTDYPDNDIYWRTAPSDVIQGDALGNLMVQNGAVNVAFIYINDPYGIGLAENATASIEEAGGAVVASVPYNPGDTDFSSQVSQVRAANPDAIGVIAFAETANIVPELIGTQGYPANQVYFVDGNLSNDYDFPAGMLEGTWGTLPGNPADDTFQSRLLEVDPDLEDFSYGPESYDAVIVAALAAAQGGSADADTIKENLQSVTEGGTKCTEVAECLELIAADEDIDYDGASGPIEFDENGDPTQAFIGIYQYGADNRYTLVDTVEGSL